MSGRLNCRNRYGSLAINSVELSSPAWCFDDLTPLWPGGGDVRGANRLISHAVGTLARRRRHTETRFDLEGVITGWYDSDGLWLSNRAQGLIDNQSDLASGLGMADDAPAGVTGTVAAVLTMPDASTMTADVHVLKLTVGRPVNDVTRAVLTISIPTGRFA